MSNRKHLIIGCGSAALSALEQIRRIETEDEIEVVTMEDYLPYSPTVLPYLLSGKINEAALPMKQDRYFEQIHATLTKGREVVRMLPEKKQVIFKDGGRATYDTLLIASGSESAMPSINGLEHTGFFGFHTIEDCKRLLEELEGKKEVVVLGAGLVGMEVAIALSEKGCRVTIIEKESRVLPLYFDQEAESLVKAIFLNNGISILTGKHVSEVSRNRGKIEISFSEGDNEYTDVMIACTGVKARTAFLKETGVAVNNGVLVDRQMMTNIEGIYAAGDVAETRDYFTGYPDMNPIILSAVEQGKVAGSNMAGVEADYSGWISTNVFNFFGNTAFSAGISMPMDNRFQVLFRKDNERVQLKKLVYNDDTLVGAMFVNVAVDPGVILHLIERRVDVSAYKEMLFEKPREISRWLMLETERRGTIQVKE